jgi:hypothetical protein
MIVRAWIAVGLLVAFATTMAQQAPVTAVAGAGSRSCAQMRMDIADLPNVRRAYVSWMQGYLSGRNAARESAGLGLIDIADYEAQWAWLETWCGSNPERAFVDALAALFAERVASAGG